MLVKFKVHHGLFNAGEQGGVRDEVARQLIARGVAVEVTAAPADRPRRDAGELIHGVIVPTMAQVIAAGYSVEAAERIVAEQKAKAEAAGKFQEGVPADPPPAFATETTGQAAPQVVPPAEPPPSSTVPVDIDKKPSRRK
jgi:hypothetical protein